MGRKKKEDVEQEEIKKPKALGPYDIIKMMFTDKDSFDKLSKLMLEKNFFMINRIMAIQFPMQAQCFNKLNINEEQVIRSWQTFATAKLGYGRVPSFVYTKGAKASQAAEKQSIDKELKTNYCLHYGLSLKDLDDMLYFNYEKTLEHIKQFEEITNSTQQLKNISKGK